MEGISIYSCLEADLSKSPDDAECIVRLALSFLLSSVVFFNREAPRNVGEVLTLLICFSYCRLTSYMHVLSCTDHVFTWFTVFC